MALGRTGTLYRKGCTLIKEVSLVHDITVCTPGIKSQAVTSIRVILDGGNAFCLEEYLA